MGIEGGRQDIEPWVQIELALLSLWEETRGGEEKLEKLQE